MFKFVNYRKTRALQICIVFATALAIQRFLGYSHAGWIGFAVMMIYAGFDRGSSLQRTTHRFWGAVLGLVLSYILWIIGQLDFRLIFVIIPTVVFMAYFSLGKLYAFPTIFTVTLTALGTDYYGSNYYPVPNFFFDYLLSTVVALIICAIYEYYIFIDSHLSRKFYLDLQQIIIAQLSDLFNVVDRQPLHRSNYLKISSELNVRVLELYAFVDAAKHDKHQEINLLDELAFFSSEVQHVYHNIRRLYVFASQRNELLLRETKHIIEQLAIINQNQKLKYIGE
jgi:hypothetical protein